MIMRVIWGENILSIKKDEPQKAIEVENP